MEIESIKYEVSPATLGNQLDNLTTHITGVGFAYRDTEEGQGAEEDIEPDLLVQASFVDVVEAAAYEDTSLKEVFWIGSEELLAVYHTLYDKNGSVYKYMNSTLGWCWDLLYDRRNLLFFDLITVNQALRGDQLALSAICRTIQRFAGEALLAVIDVRPLQFRPNYRSMPYLELDAFELDEQEARQKLVGYFAQLGFKLLPNEQYMAVNLDMHRPDISDLRQSEETECQIYQMG